MSDLLQIPASIEEASLHLGGIDKLITAKKWERSAIVYAYTYLGYVEEKGIDGKYTCAEFSRLGIAGLTAEATVHRYRIAWDIADGKTPLVPGDRVRLPTIPFPSYKETQSRLSPGSAKNKTFAERIVNHAEYAYQRASKIPLTDEDIQAVEQARDLLDDALAVVEKRRELGNLSVKLPGYSKYVDYLELVGGWLSADELAGHFDAKPNTVYQRLQRLRKLNLVESRHALDSPEPTKKYEWRAA